MIIISLVLVCWTVIYDRILIHRHNRNNNNSVPSFSGNSISNNSSDHGQSELVSNESSIQQHKKSNNFILFQAFAYIGAFFITLLFPILILTSSYYVHGPEYENVREVFRKFQLTFQPLQGFFNSCIFLSSKVYHQIQTDDSQSVMEALKKVFGKNYSDPIIISRLSLVRNSDNPNEFELHYDDNEEDEDEDELIVDKENDNEENGANFDEAMEVDVSYPSSRHSSQRSYSNSKSNSLQVSELSPYSWFSRALSSATGSNSAAPNSTTGVSVSVGGVHDVNNGDTLNDRSMRNDFIRNRVGFELKEAKDDSGSDSGSEYEYEPLRRGGIYSFSTMQKDNQNESTAANGCFRRRSSKYANEFD